MPNSKAKLSVGLVSLGCAKNTVDLQVMAGALLSEGIDLSANPDRADAILVNTCAFIEAARREANAEILRACSLKRSGKARFVVVAGCLPQRYGESLRAKYPDVDAFIGIDHLFDLPGLLRGLAAAVAPATAPARVVVSTARNTLFEPPIPDFTISGGVHASLKVADGCNHACAYCAIPSIRGRLRSRRPRDILAEARALIRGGVRELDVVAQDSTAYGRDIGDGTSLASLLARLDRMRGDFWIRILYGYPTFVTDELLELIAASRHVCRFGHTPLHPPPRHPGRAWGRADTARRIDGLAARLRAAIPGVVLRTTFIVGYPGETEAHFRHLLDYVRETRFDQLGAFVFSPEEGTPAAALDGQVPREVAEERLNRLMAAQREVVAANLAPMAGARLRVLVEAVEGGRATARSEFQAPEVDGATRIADAPRALKPGDFAEVEVTGAEGYDLLARVVAAGGAETRPRRGC